MSGENHASLEGETLSSSDCYHFYIQHFSLFLPINLIRTSIQFDTWNIVGLDSNRPADGPRQFPVGARVCNTSGTPLTNVVATMTFGNADTSAITFRTGSLTSLNLGTLAPAACQDAYYTVEVNPVAASYLKTRPYTITASADGGVTASSPANRELYVEYLVSQNRNATNDVLFGTVASCGASIPADPSACMTSVAPGGTMTLLVGGEYYIRMKGGTATQGYEQLEAFLTLPNTQFQILDVQTSFNADTSPYIASPVNQL